MSTHDNADVKDQQVDDIKKKLNNTLSSHFSDSNSIKHIDPSEDSLEDLQKIIDECAESKTCSSPDDSDSKSEHLSLDADPVNNIDKIQKAENIYLENEVQLAQAVNDELNPDLFSEAFDKVSYQSVDVDITDNDSQAVIDDFSSRYSQVVSDALKKTPKSYHTENLHNTSSSGQKTIDSSSIWDEEPEDKSVLKDESAVLSISSVSIKGKTGSEEFPLPETNKQTPESSSTASLDKLKEKVLSSNLEPSIEEKTVLPCSAIDDTKEPVRVDDRYNRNIAFLYNESHLKHASGQLSIKTHERPERLIKAMWYLQKSDVFANGSCSLIDDFDAVDESDILKVHDEEYINFVNSYAKAGGGFLGDSTYIVSESYDVAKCSAGGAIKAGDLVADGDYSYSFALTRPPGHHASKNKYGGFCLFNNAAILAKYLQTEKKFGKIMIIDWDAHAGDGTMGIFYDDPSVLFVSLHRDPHGFYPRKGFTQEVGTGAGKGYTVNVEMPAGAGDDEYIFAFDEIVLPLMDSFHPEFIICSCGFDAYHKEKNIGMEMTSTGYYQMTSRVASKFSNNFVLLMEGGYHDFNGQLCHSVLSALMGMPNPIDDQLQVSSFKADQQKKIFKQTQAKVDELKRMIPILS